ncbi:hypothetical protein Tco_0002006 [Tanacetum coccineum]
MEAHCVNLELKYQNQVLKEGQHGQFLKVKSNEAKSKHDIDVIETINIELEHKVAKLLKENETLKRHYKEIFDSIKTTRAKNIEHTTSLIANNDKFKAQLQEKGFAIQRFASQVDVNNDLSKLVTTHYLPKEKESAVTKPHHMIPPGSSRYSSNNMVHKHYLEEAKKKTQESSRNSEPSVMPSARSQSTTNGSKPKPRINNQKSRNWHASKCSCVTTKTVPIAEHSRNSRSFSDSKHFVCSTCQKCVFNENHDSCVTKFLNEVNLRAKVPSHKTTTRYKPVEQTSVAKKPERQIPIGHRFSIEKSSGVHEKIITPRSCLRWKPTSKIFKTVGLKWIPTGKIFTSSTTKVDSKLTNGSNDDITNQYECEQTLDVSAGTLNLSAGTSFNPKKGLRVCSELGIHDHNNEQSSSKLVPKVVPLADKTTTSRQELELLFHHHITMLRSTHPSDTYVLIMKMEILIEPASNKLLVDALVTRTASAAAKPCQGDSLNLPDHRVHKDGDGDALFQLKTDSLPYAHAQTTKTYYKHRDSRIMKAQELKIKTSAQTLIYKIVLQRYQVYQGRLLASFHDDAKYEHVGQNTRSQGPWSQIRKLKIHLSTIGINLPLLFKKKVANRRNTSFWHDKWLGGSALHVTYPRLYRLDLNLNFLVSDRSNSVPLVPSSEASESSLVRRPSFGRRSRPTRPIINCRGQGQFVLGMSLVSWLN